MMQVTEETRVGRPLAKYGKLWDNAIGGSETRQTCKKGAIF